MQELWRAHVREVQPVARLRLGSLVVDDNELDGPVAEVTVVGAPVQPLVLTAEITLPVPIDVVPHCTPAEPDENWPNWTSMISPRKPDDGVMTHSTIRISQWMLPKEIFCTECP